MRRRFACINDLPIKESERKFHWPLGRRPDAHPGLSDLGLWEFRAKSNNVTDENSYMTKQQSNTVGGKADEIAQLVRNFIE